MIAKWFVTAALAILVLTCRCAAQSVPELLEKGIYTQETVGDLDRAIEIYRQIVSSVSARAYAAQAQYRLAQCLLQKGSKADAAREFKKVIDGYPEEKDLVEKARESLVPLAHHVDGEYNDPVLGFSFTSPDWRPSRFTRKKDGSVEIYFLTYDPEGPYPALCPSSDAHLIARKSKLPSADIVRKVKDKLQARIEKELRMVAKYPLYEYRIRPDYISTRERKESQVQSFAVEYLNPPGIVPRYLQIEYAVWMESGETEVYIETTLRDAKYLECTRAVVDRILESIRMP